MGTAGPICGCGLVLRKATGAELRHFRCGPNLAQGPTNPAEVVITFGQLEKASAP